MATFLNKVDAAKELIRDSLDRYPRIVGATSFGKDSMVMLHLLREVKPDLPVFTVFMDTEFDETVEFSRRVAREWNLNYTELHGVQGRDVPVAECCGRIKVEKHREVLANYDAWFSGIRKTEGVTRANFEFVEQKGGLVKINPILEFTELDVWRYTALFEIPINPKYKEGYRSLGCAICSVPEENEELPERHGRWRGTDREGGECGIHTQVLKEKAVQQGVA